MSRPVFGQAALCRTCSGSGRVTFSEDQLVTQRCPECRGRKVLPIKHADVPKAERREVVR